MKCPPKVKVGYKDIDIDLVRSDFTKQTDCYGEYQHRANKIEIQKDLYWKIEVIFVYLKCLQYG